MAVSPETQQAFLDSLQAGDAMDAIIKNTPLEKVLAAPASPEIYYPAFGGDTGAFRRKLQQDLGPEGDVISERVDGGTELHQKVTVVGLNLDMIEPNNFSNNDLVDNDFDIYINFGYDNLPETVIIGQKKHKDNSSSSDGAEIVRVVRYLFSDTDENGVAISDGGRRFVGWESYLMVDNQLVPSINYDISDVNKRNVVMYGGDAFGQAWDELQFSIIPGAGKQIAPNTKVRPLTQADYDFLHSKEMKQRGIVVTDLSPDNIRVVFSEAAPSAVDRVVFIQRDAIDGNFYPTRLSWSNLEINSFNLRGDWFFHRNIKGEMPERYIHSRTQDANGNPMYGSRVDVKNPQNP